MTELEQATELWTAVKTAVPQDDRKLWLAWKRAYRARVWRQFGMMGPGQLCQQDGLPFDQILRRITAYELNPSRDLRADETELSKA